MPRILTIADEPFPGLPDLLDPRPDTSTTSRGRRRAERTGELDIGGSVRAARESAPRSRRRFRSG